MYLKIVSKIKHWIKYFLKNVINQSQWESQTGLERHEGE